MMYAPRQRHARQRGTAIIEFAIALPLLLLLIMGTFELGRLLTEYDTLNKTVRDAARYLASNALSGTTGVVTITPAVRTATANLVVTGNAAGSGAALLPALSASNVTVSNLGNGYVSVSAAYTYAPALGSRLPTFGLGPPINMTLQMNATAVMRPL